MAKACGEDDAGPSAVADPLQEYVDREGAVVCESSHNYEDNANSHEWVELAGAAAIGVVFDPQTKTENNYGTGRGDQV